MSIKIVPINKSSLALRVLIGAFIGLLLISLFLLGPGIDSNPDWSRYWRIRPLIIVPSAGAMGGLFNYRSAGLSSHMGKDPGSYTKCNRVSHRSMAGFCAGIRWHLLELNVNQHEIGLDGPRTPKQNIVPQPACSSHFRQRQVDMNI